MTRDSRRLSAVFAAALVILASGTAVSLAVTSSPSDAGTNAVAMQETTTAADGETTAEDGVEETTTMTADEPAEQDQASVTIDEQETGGAQVVIESATLPEGGFIAIHDSTYADAPLSSVLGNSVYLEAGTHEDVTVTLARPIEGDQTLVAMPHLDTNENRVYDFVLSTGDFDGPYTADGQVVVDEANVTVAPETTTTTAEADGTTTEAVDETTTEAVDDETTTEEVVDETTTEAPAEMEQFVFKVEQMNIDEWSFVVGDEEQPDRTEVVSGFNVQDRRVTINLSEALRQSAAAQQQQMTPMTTPSPEEVEQMLEENLSQDIPTVRYVIRDVSVENVTFVVTAPEDIELPQPPMTTEPDAPDEETTTEEVVDETTTEAVDEETTTEAVDETTTEAVDGETTTEEVVDETTTEAVDETTTAEAAPDSFTVSGLDAPANATAGDTIEVSATVSNPTDQQLTQDVAFRLEGTVLARQSVTLDAGEQTNVTFGVATEGVPGGQYIHGVYTRDFGDLAIIVIEEPSAETTTAAGTETPADGETTVETTTEA